mgnify:FL=1
MLLQDPVSRFSELYGIYERSFPEVEKRTEAGQRAVWENPRVRVRIMERDGRIAAFLSCWKLENCLFVEHLATDPECRGGGLGRLLMEECILEANEAGIPVVLEIEPVTEERPDTVRRAAFYERLGFCANHFPYEQPPLREGAPVIPLSVMTYGRPMDEGEFQPYKTEIYREVYGREAF